MASSMERGQQSSMNVVARAAKKEEADGEKKPVKKNDIRPIRFRKQLARVNLDLDSPRMRQAMTISGVSEEDLEKK